MARLLANDTEMLNLLGVSSTQATSPVGGEILLQPSTGDNPSALVGGAYEAAERFNAEFATWNPSFGSADDDIIPVKKEMDARVRDTIRNDGFASAGSTIRKDNIVGAMYLLNSKPDYKYFDQKNMDDAWAEEFQEEVETKFTLWAESPMNWVDASRINNFTSLVRLAVGLDTMGGEVLAVAEWIDGRPYKTAIQMIDLDRLDNPPMVLDTDKIRGGIERDRYGAPVAAYIRQAHPSNYLKFKQQQFKRVPFEKPWGRKQVIHLFEQFRPEQTRGVSDMVTSLKESRTAKRFRETVLQNAVVNATYAASIESELPTEVVFQALGAKGLDGDQIQAAIESYTKGYYGAISKYLGSSKNIHLNGVKIPHLYPGTKFQLRPAAQGGPLGTEFEQSLLRHLAASLGVSYEQLSRDYSRTNYSSARAAMTEIWKTMQARKRLIADRFATIIFTLWLEEAFAKGEITSLPRNAPNFWDRNRLNREAYSACEWIGASKGQIDELKETQAAVLRLKYGLSTREDELGRLGKDWRKVFSQLAREDKLAKSYNLVFTEDDNMMNAATGAPRESEAKDEKDDGSEDNADA